MSRYRTRVFATLAILGLFAALFAEEETTVGGKDARIMWYDAHQIYQKAEEARQSGDAAEALIYYRRAVKALKDVNSLFPKWENQPLVEYRIGVCEERIKTMEKDMDQAVIGKSVAEISKENRELRAKIIDLQASLFQSREQLEESLLNTEKERRERGRDSQSSERVKTLLREKIDMEKRYDSLKSSYDELREKKEDDTPVRQLRLSLLEKQRQLDKAYDVNRKFEKELEESKKRLQDLSVEKARLEVEKEKVTGKAGDFEQTEKALKQSREELETARANQAGLEKQNAELLEKLKSERMKSLERKELANNEKARELTKKLNDAGEQNAKLLRENQQLASSATELKRHNERLNRTLANIEEERRSLKTALNAKDAATAADLNKVNEAKSKISELESELETRKKDYQLLAENYRKAKAQADEVADARETNQTLRARMVKMEQANAALEKDLASLRQNQLSTEKALAQANAEAKKNLVSAKNATELAAANEKIKTLETNLNAAAEKLADSERRATELKTMLEGQKIESVKKLRNDLDDEKSRCSRATRDAQQATARATELEAEREKWAKEKENLLEQLDRARETSTKALAEVEQVKDERLALETTRKKLLDLESRFKETDRQLKDALGVQAKFERLNALKEELAKRLENALADNEKARAAVATKEEKEKTRVQEALEAKKKIAELESARAASEKALAEHKRQEQQDNSVDKAEFDKLKEQATALEKSEAEKSAALKRAKENIETLTNDLAAARMTRDTAAQAAKKAAEDVDALSVQSRKLAEDGVASMKTIQALEQRLAETRKAAATVPDLITKTRELETRLEEARKQNASAGANAENLTALTAKTRQLETANAAATKRVAELEAKLAEMAKTPAPAAPATIAAKPGEVERLRDENTRLKTERDGLEKKVREQENVINLRNVMTAPPAAAAKPRPDIAALSREASETAKREPKKAIALYEKILTIDPNCVEALSRSGRLALTVKDYPSAVRRLEQATRLKADDSENLVALGFAYSKSGATEKAIEALTQAVTLSPNDALAFRYLGAARAVLGQREAALTDMKRSFELDPKSAETAYNIAATLITIGPERQRESSEWYRKSLTLGGSPDPELERFLKAPLP